ncbi:MAG: glycosyltransferase family 39 protein [Anaerolineae bacterium]|jgi:4-amino-4-deoxy-L-arabinose transferase-like glycosyltransferase
MSESLQNRLARWVLPAIILLYLAVGGLYAVLTPAWQAPDEPAHYNYIKYLAEQHRFPILKAGDFPAAYLEEIKAAKFPREMSIAPIRYEFHQPPLYYLVAVPVYSLFGGALLPLRLLSVAMGALLLVVIYWIGIALVPQRRGLAWGATAFVAFLPMHLAMTAAANNDVLAELLLALVLLLSIRYLRRVGSDPHSGQGPVSDWPLLLLLSISTGLAFLTKSGIYIVLPVVLLAIAVRYTWLEKRERRMVGLLAATGFYLAPALLLGLPWWLRNMALYGGFDFLGLGRHDQVVAGQLRTAEFVAAHGLPQLVRDFVATSFRSFWGQFGWMGVLLDVRLYQALAILSTVALVGFVLWAIRAWRRRIEVPAWQWAAGGLLFISGLLTLASYLWYNTQFVQHQGRYLFTALVPLSLAAALGWREALRRERALLLAALLLVLAVLLGIAGLLPNWLLLMLGAVAVAFGVRHILPPALDALVGSIPYVLLILADLASLFLFILPQLNR